MPKAGLRAVATRMLLWAATLVLTLVVAAPGTTSACSIALSTGPSDCSAGFARAVIPASAQALPWGRALAPMIFRQGQDGPEPLSLSIAAGGRRHLQLMQPLVADSTYFVVCHDCDRSWTEGWSSVFYTGGDAPIPSDGGLLRAGEAVRDSMWAGTSSGSCVAPIDVVRVLFQPTLSPELEPWLPLLSFALRVDGQPWAGNASLEDPLAEADEATRARRRTRGLIYALCAEPADPNVSVEALSEGRHEVRMVATLPGGEEFLTDLVSVQLDCQAAGSGAGLPRAPDLGVALGPESPEPPDWSAAVTQACRDSGAPSPLEPLAADAGLPGRVALSDAAPDSGGCSVARPPTAGGAWALWLAAGAALLRLRRRGARCCQRYRW